MQGNIFFANSRFIWHFKDRHEDNDDYQMLVAIDRFGFKFGDADHYRDYMINRCQ